MFVFARVACFIEVLLRIDHLRLDGIMFYSCAILVLADGGKSNGLFCTLVACCPEGLLLTRAFICTNVLT